MLSAPAGASLWEAEPIIALGIGDETSRFHRDFLGRTTSLTSAEIGRAELGLNARFELNGAGGGRLRARTLRAWLTTTVRIAELESGAIYGYGDTFVRQPPLRGDPNIVGVEVGARYQGEGPWLLSAGVGSEFLGDRGRSPTYVRAGVTWEF